jgi:hypothetical protein
MEPMVGYPRFIVSAVMGVGSSFSCSVSEGEDVSGWMVGIGGS